MTDFDDIHQQMTRLITTKQREDQAECEAFASLDRDLTDIFQTGNVNALRRYWTWGAGATRIRWNTPGDMTRCIRFLRRYVAPGAAGGTCQNYYKLRYGRSHRPD